MKKILNRVTVTGADDNTDHAALVEIHRKYPFVEFGILISLSHSMTGSRRFPSVGWIEELHLRELPLAAHVCGKWVKVIFSGEWPEMPVEITLTDFRRWQLNTHGIKHKIGFEEGFTEIVTNLGDGERIIFQMDDANAATYKAVGKTYPGVADGLYDLSHGAGVLPDRWPEPTPGLNCGYAGGLSPSNVAAQLDLIAQVTDGPTWIDAETHLRSEDDARLDLKKVEVFLEAAKPWVI